MSLILRHKPETINISLDEHGWANVDELIAGIAELIRVTQFRLMLNLTRRSRLQSYGMVPVKYLVKQQRR